MDLLLFNLLFLLSSVGICLGQSPLPSGPVDAILGKNITLEVLIKLNGADNIAWGFSDGSKLVPILGYSAGSVRVMDSYKGRAFLDTTNGYLTLTGLTAKDSGDYSINIIGTQIASGEIKLRVLVPVSNVVITPDVTETMEGRTVSLNCSAKGSFLEFIWTNGSIPIKVDGNRITQITAEFSNKLIIRDVLRSDFSNPIFCTAKNGLQSEKSRPLTLTVFYGPDVVTINPPNPPEFIKSKDDFNLSCSAASKPDATFSWFFNNQLIKNSGAVLTLKTIEELGLGKTAGDYKCNAVNSKTTNTRNSSAVRFSVIEPLSGIKLSGPTHTLFAGNTTANLSCQASAGKVMKTVWMINNVPLSPSPRVVFSADNSLVTINPVQKEDNVNFTCKLENPVSQEQAEYKMEVIYGPEEASISGVKEVDLKSSVILKCSAASIPPSRFTWKLNGSEISEKTNEVVIEKPKFENSGIYTCEARNPSTGKTVTFLHTLTVKEEIDDGLSDGAIAGIVIGCLLALGLALGLFFYCRAKVPKEGYTVGKRGSQEP
ncbi:Carcinoembryonic antigen-related cell adhesion molecule 5 [Oryzias melastigma]|uniref:Carcinoembryonic antigen-related cell adhesion molecule 5 n=1 Tax=Oryzias melastigma TaxID=30732 RepID=A0A834FR27_ORYME|nr:Carcinoembryonic antigen-related cell adhesion molecule 5 [Oryzias melastigma]